MVPHIPGKKDPSCFGFKELPIESNSVFIENETIAAPNDTKQKLLIPASNPHEGEPNILTYRGDRNKMDRLATWRGERAWSSALQYLCSAEDILLEFTVERP